MYLKTPGRIHLDFLSMVILKNCCPLEGFEKTCLRNCYKRHWFLKEIKPQLSKVLSPSGCKECNALHLSQDLGSHPNLMIVWPLRGHRQLKDIQCPGSCLLTFWEVGAHDEWALSSYYVNVVEPTKIGTSQALQECWPCVPWSLLREEKEQTDHPWNIISQSLSVGIALT